VCIELPCGVLRKSQLRILVVRRGLKPPRRQRRSSIPSSRNLPKRRRLAAFESAWNQAASHLGGYRVVFQFQVRATLFDEFCNARTGYRRHRYVIPSEVPVCVMSGRWGPRRARVEQCHYLAAELLYHQMVCESRPIGPGFRGSLTWTPTGSSRSWNVDFETLANAVWRRGRLFLRCTRRSIRSGCVCHDPSTPRRATKGGTSAVSGQTNVSEQRQTQGLNEGHLEKSGLNCPPKPPKRPVAEHLVSGVFT
jgi:hypothetical protein